MCTIVVVLDGTQGSLMKHPSALGEMGSGVETLARVVTLDTQARMRLDNLMIVCDIVLMCCIVLATKVQCSIRWRNNRACPEHQAAPGRLVPYAWRTRWLSRGRKDTADYCSLAFWL